MAASSIEPAVPKMLPFDESDMVHCFDDFYMKLFGNSMYYYEKQSDIYRLVCVDSADHTFIIKILFN